jgi:large subunit ribosomal protein L35
MKTHRGAAKRLKVTGTGKIMKHNAFKRHMLESKPPKRKRNLRKAEVISHGDTRRARRMLGI